MKKRKEDRTESQVLSIMRGQVIKKSTNRPVDAKKRVQRQASRVASTISMSLRPFQRSKCTH